MVGRTEVRYIESKHDVSLIGKTRWMDHEGKLFLREDGGEWVSRGFTINEPGSTVHRKSSGSAAIEVVHRNPFTLGPIKPTAPARNYADGNPKSIQGAKKYSLRYLPLPANIVVNQALEDGAKKYGAANWRQTGVAATVYVDAAQRHLAQWFDGGQELALDSLVHNLGHAMACLAIIVDAQANGSLIDDRPFACKDTDALLLRKVTA